MYPLSIQVAPLHHLNHSSRLWCQWGAQWRMVTGALRLGPARTASDSNNFKLDYYDLAEDMGETRGLLTSVLNTASMAAAAASPALTTRKCVAGTQFGTQQSTAPPFSLHPNASARLLQACPRWQRPGHPPSHERRDSEVDSALLSRPPVQGATRAVL
jgi:hypothetical protein